jgi:hypothetical protein
MLIKTPNITSDLSRVDFNNEDFEKLLRDKGRDVVVEKSLVCPCKSENSGGLSNCKNCGGSGWAFINPTKTRMVVQSMSLSNDFKDWSETSRGMIKVSARKDEHISHMDKITALHATSVFTESFFVKKVGEIFFAYTTYEIKDVEYCAFFKTENTQYEQINKNVHYTIDGNVFKIIDDDLIEEFEELSITIRYTHAPVYYVLDLQRESMESFVLNDGSEDRIDLPITFMARRAHYVLNMENTNKNRILDNSNQVVNLNC